jgi:hypothetical protein
MKQPSSSPGEQGTHSPSEQAIATEQNIPVQLFFALVPFSLAL